MNVEVDLATWLENKRDGATQKFGAKKWVELLRLRREKGPTP